MKESLGVNTTISHYRILQRLGAGGMGEVYLAHDTKLGRKVAIKFLASGSVADEQAKKRLVREAQAAAKLDHSNICAIHEVGEEDGRSFIVMQYVEGETLADRIHRRQLELSESLDIAVQVADALTEAHSQGIIHRDIKPQNIMITARGQVKVMDFGLAKVVAERDRFESDAETQSLLTAPGMIVGTVPYMSPEQVRGEALDARSDIFSFGAVLYEIASGHQAFLSESAAATFSAILTRELAPLARYSKEVPAELERIVNKALRKDKEERYQGVKDLLIDLKSLLGELGFQARMERSAPPDMSDGAKLEASGRQVIVDTPKHQATRTDEIAALTTLSDAYIISGIGRHKVAFVALAFALVALVGVGVYLMGGGGKTVDSLAVLPFANGSNDPNAEYLSDGITESIINSLSQLPQLRVMARTTVFRYKGQDLDPQKVGRDLSVGAVVSGKVSQLGDRLIVQVEMMSMADGSQLWGEQYNRKLTDIMTMQGDISRDISAKLRLKLTGENEKRLAKSYTENTEAYQLYLRGRFYWNKRTREAYKKAIEFFNQALEKDPNYALAYSGLADCYSLADYPLPPKEKYPLARQAALKALELDDTLAEPHAALGRVKQEYDWDREGAEKEFKRAIELNPNSPLAHMRYAGFFAYLGKHQEAIAESKQALALDPLSALINWDLAFSYYWARRYDEAIEQDLRTLEIDPNYIRSISQIGASYQQKGMFEKAFEWYLKSAALEGRTAEIMALKEAYTTSGVRGYYRKRLDLEMAKAQQNANNVATFYARLDDKERALEWLQKAIEEHSAELLYLRISPAFDNMRSDPRFVELMTRVGLAP
ncbi:MAG: protein kinase [Acidobacteriota bacterium]